ncbi:MAG: hypothetical protein AAFU67_17855, partial [Bacteroidota bacterium]
VLLRLSFLNTFVAVQVPSIPKKVLSNWLPIVILGTGITLWVINLLANRGLFLDEANLALNLGERNWDGFFQPLDYQQYCPPLFLVLTKQLVVFFSYKETILRLPAFFGGLIALYGLWLAGRSLQLGYWVWLSIALLFTNTLVLHYVTEFKPYGLDMGLAVLILARASQKIRPSIWWLLIGCLYCWLSLPAVFLLAAIGTYAILNSKWWSREQIYWLLISLGWAASFLLYYVLILRTDSVKPGLISYHSAYFFPLRWFEWQELERGFHLIIKYFSNIAGYTTLATVMGLVMCIIGVLSFERRKDRRWWLLLFPLILAFLVSSFRLYSLIPRMMLFSLPGVLLLVAEGAAASFKFISSRKKKILQVTYILLWLLILGSTSVPSKRVVP